MVKGQVINHILIDKYKLIFTVIPKNANTSVKYILVKDFFPFFLNNININDPDKIHSNTIKLFNFVNHEFMYNNNDYLRISIVRNPFDRLVSGWRNKIKNLNLINFKRPRRHGFTKACNFKEFIHQIYNTSEEKIDRHFVPQYRFITYNDIIFSDRILKFENLTEDWDNLIQEIYIRNKIKLSRLTINLNNTKNNKSYREYYDKDLIKLVEKKFERDLNIFNYEF
jgi:hypothetical protein